MKIWILLLLVSYAQAQTTVPVKCPLAALTEAQVSDLVKGGVPEGRVVQIISTCHVGFNPSSEAFERVSNSGVPESILDAVIRDRYSIINLASVRAEFAVLKQKVAERTASSDAARDAALARLDADYASQLANAALVTPRDEFESDASFAARKKRTEAAAEDLGRAHVAERARISAQYTDELAGRTQLLNRLMSTLRERTYQDDGVTLDYLRYEANRNQLIAMVGPVEYWFTVPNDKARELHARWKLARLEGGVEEDSDRTRSLLDPVLGERYPGAPRGVVEERERAAVAAVEAAAAAQKERQRREALARLVWVDEKTRLMWTRTDNGSSVDWNQAADFCRSLTLGEYRDWRLPDIDELQGISDPTLRRYKEGGIAGTNTDQWSGSKDGSDWAWLFHFSRRTRQFFPLESKEGHALCVRRAGVDALAAKAGVDVGSVIRGEAMLVKAREAMGGESAFAAIKDVSETITVENQSTAQHKITIHQQWVAPGYSRIDSDGGSGSITSTTYTDGKTGWAVRKSTGVVVIMQATALQAFAFDNFKNLFYLMLSDKDPSRIVTTSGDGKLEIADSNGQSVSLTLDPASNLPASESYFRTGESVLTEEFFSDWRQSDGLKLPHRIMIQRDGKHFVDHDVPSIKINQGLTPEQISKKP